MAENERRLPFPEAGEDAYIEFDLDALMALEEAFGVDYYQKIQAGLEGFNVAVLAKIASVGLHDGLMKSALKKVSLKDFAMKMGDGLAIFTHGTTLAELRVARADEMAGIMMRAKIAEIIAAREVTLAAVAPAPVPAPVPVIEPDASSESA